MAIYPYTNTYVINKDAVAGSSFKAGMVLMMNTDGKAVPANSQSLVYNSTSQKQAKILGIAAGDSNLTGNTIIVPDTVGNNYLDENKNFVNASNAEYVAIRRQLLDYADETINEYYNMNFSPIPKRRGIGVYCLTGDTFATDQFSAVLHGDYGIDDTDLITFSPGDLLTFGGGVNAGKLVKVNTNSVGPDVIVVGTVEKYNSAVGLLYFKNTNYILRFSSASLIMSLDAGNSLSYSDSSSILANDLTLNNNDGTLTNGVGYDAAGGGSWVFDGTNDFITVPITNYTLNLASVTVFCWVNLALPAKGTLFHLGPFNSGITVGVGVVDNMTLGTKVTLLYSGIVYVSSSYDFGTYLNGWNFVAISFDSSKYPTVYLNNNAGVYVANRSFTAPYSNIVTIGKEIETTFHRYITGKIAEIRMFSRDLSGSEILAYYNTTKSRYGL
jgi:hypothetical protein